MASILAVLAQDPDTGIITYGDTNIRHEHKNQVVLEFLDFYGEQSEIKPRYLVFDSKFTIYKNLGLLNFDRSLLPAMEGSNQHLLLPTILNPLVVI